MFLNLNSWQTNKYSHWRKKTLSSFISLYTHFQKKFQYVVDENVSAFFVEINLQKLRIICFL